MTDEQVARLRELAERARKPQGWKRIAFQAARLDEFREAASPDVVIRLLDELDRLRHENHNLNWALDTDGYEQMYTEAERVEHADAVARITEHLDRLAARKARLDALVPAGVDILDHIDALRRERDEARAHLSAVLRHPARIRTGVMAAGYVGGACEHTPGDRAKVTLFYEGAETAEAAFQHITDAIDALHDEQGAQ